MVAGSLRLCRFECGWERAEEERMSENWNSHKWAVFAQAAVRTAHSATYFECERCARAFIRDHVGRCWAVDATKRQLYEAISFRWRGEPCPGERVAKDEDDRAEVVDAGVVDLIRDEWARTAIQLVTELVRKRAEVFQRLLGVKDRLEIYDFLQKRLVRVDVVTDSSYQGKYNDFYRMLRFTTAEWRFKYYRLLQREKYNYQIGIGDVLRELCNNEDRLEFSFTSKLVATIRPGAPSL
jgi:hypothetical protein